MRVPFLGDPHDRELKRHRDTVRRINDLEPEIEALSDEELIAKTQEFRDRLGVEGPDLGLGQPVSATLVVTGDEDADDEAAERRRGPRSGPRGRPRLRGARAAARVTRPETGGAPRRVGSAKI